MFENYPDILTINDVAEILHVHRNTVKKNLQHFSYRKIGRVYRVSKKSVEDYMTGRYDNSEEAVI